MKHWILASSNKTFSSSRELEYSNLCQVGEEQLEFFADIQGQWHNAVTDMPGVWRYLPLLPVSEDAAERVMIPGKPEFMKPVLSRELAKKLGVNKVYLFPYQGGPSGTFKDVEAAVVVAKCIDWGFEDETISIHSTGNTARAYRAFATQAGIKSVAYVPFGTRRKMQGAGKSRLGKVVYADVPFETFGPLVSQHAKDHGYRHLAPLKWKVEGKAPHAYHIFENAPDVNVITQTVGGGFGPIGTHTGMNRLRKYGLLNHPVRFELVQVDESNAIDKMLQLNGHSNLFEFKFPKDPFEPTLFSTNAAITLAYLKPILQQTGSHITSTGVSFVEDHAQALMMEAENYGLELSYDDERCPFIAWAGLLKAAEKGQLKPTDNVALMLTGSPKRTGVIPNGEIIFS